MVERRVQILTCMIFKGRSTASCERADTATHRVSASPAIGQVSQLTFLNSTPAANVAALAATFLFGSSAVVVRVVVQDIGPIVLAVFRYLPGVIGLALVMAFRYPALLRVARRDILLLGMLGMLFYALQGTAYNQGLRFTEASRGALMIATTPMWTALLARLFGRERLAPQQYFGMLIALAGVGVVLTEHGMRWDMSSTGVVGNFLMLSAALCMASYAVFVQGPLSRYSFATVTIYAMAGGTLLLIPAAGPEQLIATATSLRPNSILLILYLAIGGGVVASLLWLRALQILTPTRATIYLNLHPLVATALSAMFLTERLSFAFGGGLAAVMIGVLLVNLPPRRLRLRE